eukprot:TRINITY_DN72296_c0_g1_i1.p1 TRINITY_DN72296_c0_g1~~TRINITY_DN72296_c0_g1_i1.p1  ORF type:complete len:863 (+),score=137.31 TRINITY_DN72296_c0_g1_i1:285-2591(+)
MKHRAMSWQRFAEAYLAEEASLAQRQAVAMMRHVWKNYEERAFGKDELRPVSGIGTDSWGGVGQTLVDALDTLWLMGFREEFERGALWVQESLNFDKDLNLNLFETTIRQLGGLLSAFLLSGRTALFEKAKDLGTRLFHAFPAPVETALVERATNDSIVPKESGKWSEGVKALLKQAGISEDQLSTLFQTDASSKIAEKLKEMQATPSPSTVLPSSDVNLQTGATQNLAGFVSLAEAYVPMEWKVLSALTSNCSYKSTQDRLLRGINSTTDLQNRGLTYIMLKPDGHAFPSTENRISLGSRGDSFYEYLLKDALFSGQQADPLTHRLWKAFKATLPQLLIEVSPTSAIAAADKKKKLLERSSKKKKSGTTGETAEPIAQKASGAEKSAGRGYGGSLGGWFETWHDSVGPLLFLKEVTFAQTVPKMDHLICFLPGALALDAMHQAHRRIKETRKSPECTLAHKFAQTCVHMYFRTVSDLAPEITRFNAFGLVDDLGSMHNILRPETIESLFVLWRTTKMQIYRNWGQRMLSAFYRTKTKYGFASLHNVNEPSKKRDDMPSFFVAETIKYLYLLFSTDSTLPLTDYVLSTEAHPMPKLSLLDAPGFSQLCGSYGDAQVESTSSREHSERASRREGAEASAQAQAVRSCQSRIQELEQQLQQEKRVCRDLPRDMQAAQHVDAIVDTEPESQEQEGKPELQHQDQAEFQQRETQQLRLDEHAEFHQNPAQGDESCWAGDYTFESCCFPLPQGNALCWDTQYTFQRCCSRSSA